MKTLIILVLAAGILFVTNPDSDDFSDHIRERIQERMTENVDESSLANDLSDLGANITARLAREVTSRKDYLLFSMYEIDPTGTDDETRWKYLGIAGQFVQLEGPNTDE
jgi:hypothetical protein